MHSIDSAFANGAQGIVIAGSGAGSTSSALGPYIEKALEEGIPVVASTRTGSGAVVPGNDWIASGFLNPPHSRIQLQLAIATGLGFNETKAGFENVLASYVL